MIKTTQLQKRSKQANNIATHKNLSIQFSLDGFSFCITDAISKKNILFTNYVFKNTVSTPEVLLDKIINIFATDTDLQQDFTSVIAIHQNNLATLVPTTYFDRNNLAPYLKYTVKTLLTDFITYDCLLNNTVNTVYIPYVNINNYLFQNFGEFEYKHHSTVLIEKLVHFSKENSEAQFFVHVSKNHLDIIVCKNDSLLFYNTFTYTTKEDFIYYILFTAEQLQLNPDVFQLTFIGDIEKDSDLYKITYTYVRNINFMNPISNFFADDTTFSNHSNYILLN